MSKNCQDQNIDKKKNTKRKGKNVEMRRKLINMKLTVCHIHIAKYWKCNECEK